MSPILYVIYGQSVYCSTLRPKGKALLGEDMKKLINQPRSVVRDMLEGLMAQAVVAVETPL